MVALNNTTAGISRLNTVFEYILKNLRLTQPVLGLRTLSQHLSGSSVQKHYPFSLVALIITPMTIPFHLDLINKTSSKNPTTKTPH